MAGLSQLSAIQHTEESLSLLRSRHRLRGTHPTDGKPLLSQSRFNHGGPLSCKDTGKHWQDLPVGLQCLVNSAVNICVDDLVHASTGEMG